MKVHPVIAIISYHTCPLASSEGKVTGGMNVYVLELSRRLGQLGVAVDIFTRSEDKEQPHIVQVAPNVRVLHVSAGPQHPYPKKKLYEFVPEFVKNINLFIEKNQLHYDLYHAHYFLSGLAALDLNQMRKEDKPFVMTFHTLALMKNLVARTAEEKDSKFRTDSELKLIGATKIIIAPSENDKHYLEYLYDCPSEKIAVITPGVNTNLFKPIPKLQARRAIGAHPDHKIILFVGRIEPLKGIDVLLYAIKILLKRNPKMTVCLWIVGGDMSQKRNLWSSELKKLETLKETLHLGSVVKFVGQKPQQDLPSYYNAADVVVMPSHYESFGMTALEAMACGTPVVATNVSGITGLIVKREEALVSSANNPLLLASQIERLITDKEWHKHLSRELLTKVKNFTWANTARHMLTVYQEVIQ